MGRPTRRLRGPGVFILSLVILLPALWLLAPGFVVSHRATRGRGARESSGCPRRVQAAVEDKTLVETQEVDFYEILGVDTDATMPDIKAAYRQAARLTHPDFFRTKPKEERDMAQERFTLVNKAFEVLTDPKKRQAYDLRGLAGLAEYEFNGERIIMPPPWRVRVGYTGHHFWTMREYFVGFMLETLPDVSYEAITKAYEQAIKEPIGVGQAILVERCTEKRAKDVVDALMEYGLVCMCEEVPDEELREEEEKESKVVTPPSAQQVAPPPPAPPPVAVPQPVATPAPPQVTTPQPVPVAQVAPTQVKPPQEQNGQTQTSPAAKEPPSTWRWPESAKAPPKPQPVVAQAPPARPHHQNGKTQKAGGLEPPSTWAWPESAKSPPCYQGAKQPSR